ncbi:unnamed protein product, partial [Rotaria magnacalcarata]
MVAFVKRVDLEIPDNRITEALTKVGLDVINVTRLNRKHGNIPTSTTKITFKNANNRNTFIHTGLQVDSVHFNAEAASQNKNASTMLHLSSIQSCSKVLQNKTHQNGKKSLEETTKRLFESLQQKIKKIEQTISSVEALINDDIISSSSSSHSDEDIQI